jgi:hypothetical protein
MKDETRKHPSEGLAIPHPLFAPVVLLMLPVGIFYILWQTVPAIRGVLDAAFIVCWLAGLFFVRVVSVKAAIRWINQIAEKFVNPADPNSDDPPDSN